MDYQKEIQKLQQKLDNTYDFMEQTEIAGKIHELKMQRDNIKPDNTQFECVGCGS